MNDDMHPKFILITATSGMYSSLKPLPKPPSVLSASRTLRCISVDDIYPIGVKKWSPFLTPGISRENSSPPPFFKRKRPVFTGVAA
jgi:hypothetical protein